MKAKFITISLAAIAAICVLWFALVTLDFLNAYFSHRPDAAYETLPFEFKLKAKSDAVLFSRVHNTPDGKDVVKYAYIADEVPVAEGEDVTRRTSNSQTTVLKVSETADGEKVETLKTSFYTSPQFYEDDGVWKQIEYATTTPEIFAMSGAIRYVEKRQWLERLLPGEPLYAASATYYPDANPESTTVDGYVQMALTGDQMWGYTAYDTQSTVYTTSSYGIIGDGCPPMGCPLYGITAQEWGILLFNTAALPDTAVIDSVTLALYVTSKAGSNTCSVRSSNPTSNTAIDNNDHLTLGGTNFFSQTCSSYSTGTYNNLSLNSSGISNVSKTGVSKFGTISSDGAAANEGIVYSSADQTGTSQDPRLDVVYDSKGFSFGMWFPF